MHTTYKEIINQYTSLQQTYTYLLSKRDDILQFGQATAFDAVCYIGCGSGYCLCKSGEWITNLLLGKRSFSLAAGDLMMNFPKYRTLLQNCLLVAPSRSGSTSEVLFAIEKAKAELGCKCVAISAIEDSRLNRTADLNLEIPWAFDRSVCQTQTVTNLYTALLLFNAILGHDEGILAEVRHSIQNGPGFMAENEPRLKAFVQRGDWDYAIILADGELQGIASEAAIAFNEIAQMSSGYFHILDVRHGPVVIMGRRTLVILMLSPYGATYQTDLIRDFKQKGASVVSIGPEARTDTDLHITIPRYAGVGVDGIPFIFAPQMLAYYKAQRCGMNPDIPQGLDAWIELKA